MCLLLQGFQRKRETVQDVLSKATTQVKECLCAVLTIIYIVKTIALSQITYRQKLTVMGTKFEPIYVILTIQYLENKATWRHILLKIYFEISERAIVYKQLSGLVYSTRLSHSSTVSN